MRTKAALYLVLFCIPLLMGCNYEKSISKNTNGETKVGLPGETQNQSLYAKEVEMGRRTRLLKPRPGQMEIIAASSLQKNIEPDKKIKTPETEIKQPVVEKKVVADTPVMVKEIYIAATPAKNMIEKDTLVKKTSVLPKTGPAMPQPAYTPELAANYMREPSVLKKFSIVVGSFTELEVAYKSVLDMKKIDYTAIIVQNKDRYRVIVGTFNDRDNAELLKLTLNLDQIDSWVLVK
ncbi:MAG: SPOR domain-containing protein [Bacteroidales bacterium]|nr:SPOR domain-containing protein [Bacteroidales bacterium]